MFKNNTYRSNTVLHTLLLVFGLLLSTSLVIARQSVPMATAAPSTYLNFQARLKTSSGSVVPDGFYNIEFKLYDASSGGSALWTETRTGANVVRVANGYFTVSLGSVTAFPGSIDWSEQHWITMNIGGTGSPTWDGEMNPRLLLTAVPHAFHATRANALSDGTTDYTPDDFIKIAPGALQGTASAESAVRINQTGAGGLLQLQSGGNDIFTVSNSGQTTVRNSSTAAFRVQNAAGTGTSLLVDTNNNRVGIGTTTFAANAQLQVGDGSGNVNIYLAPSASGQANLYFDTSGANSITFDRNTNEMFLNSNGGVLSVDYAGVSINRNLYIGTESATDTLLVLDNKTTSGDPTGTNGAMYYNADAGKFRCYEGGIWKDCISGVTATGDIMNGGNAEGGAITIGTNDEYALNFETHGVTRALFSTEGHFLPGANNTYDLGSSSIRWRDLYLGPSSLHVGTDENEAVISYVSATESLSIDKNLAIQGGSLTVGQSETIDGMLKLLNATNAFVATLQASSITADRTYELPDSDGTVVLTGGSASGGSQNFNYTGSQQTFVVPAGITELNIRAAGGSGSNGAGVGTSSGGTGAIVESTIAVTPGETIYVYVGGEGNAWNGGWNGGGNGASGGTGGGSGGGGGATDVRRGGNGLANRVIVAGGGGGGGATTWHGTNGWGGDGGLSEVTGKNGGKPPRGGGGGSGVAGGAAGTGSGNSATAGSLGVGGNGGSQNGGGISNGGGGGGGGLYGGGGGRSGSDTSGEGGGGGGGGSSLIPSGGELLGQNTGLGYMQISWTGHSTAGTIPVFGTGNKIGDSIITQESGTITIAGSLSVTTDVTISGNVTIGDGTGKLLVLDNKSTAGDPTGTNGAMYYNSALGKFRCYEGGEWKDCIYSPRPVKRVTLSAEYMGATISADGTNNVGSMTSDFCSGSLRRNINTALCGANEEHSYYTWTTDQGSAQDYDIYVRYQVPSDFDGFVSDSTLGMYGWRSTGSDSVQLAVFQADGTQCGSTTTATTTNGTWTFAQLTGNESSCSVSAGDMIVFRVKVTATNGNFARAGDITFQYFAKF